MGVYGETIWNQGQPGNNATHWRLWFWKKNLDFVI